jgi:SAM-dependent methyltransferase
MKKIKENLQNTPGYTSHDFDGTVNKECPGYGHGDGIRHSIPEDHATYYNLAKDISDKYPTAKKILELGCGAGNLSSHYREINPDVLYVTIDINAVSPTLGLINPDYHIIAFTDRPFDIVDENDNKIHFDLILSFEHFEHIPEERVPQLLTNIKNHSHSNTSIIATAATFSSVIHPTAWTKEKWGDVLDENGLQLMDDDILNWSNKPCNFSLENTSELIFKLK